MEVILLERVEKLGQMGDVVTVKDGYARNYLLPQNKALRATKQNKERFEQERAQLEARNIEARKEAEDIAERMDGLSVILIRAASDMDQLYGSVTSRDIAEAVSNEGFSITRNQVRIDRPIKTTGMHDVAIRLHPEVTVNVVVNIARSQEEAELQARGESPADLAAAEARADAEAQRAEAAEAARELNEDEVGEEENA